MQEQFASGHLQFFSRSFLNTQAECFLKEYIQQIPEKIQSKVVGAQDVTYTDFATGYHLVSSHISVQTQAKWILIKNWKISEKTRGCSISPLHIQGHCKRESFFSNFILIQIQAKSI